MRKKRRARGHHRMTSNVFNMFTQPQIAEFKEAFKMIDQGEIFRLFSKFLFFFLDQDGFIDGDDLKDMFLSLGAPVDDDFVGQMLAEAPGPINFTMFLTLFGQNRLSDATYVSKNFQ